MNFSIFSLRHRISFGVIVLLSAGLCATSASAEENGVAIFDSTCSSCHSGGFRGFMSGAPKAGKDSAWENQIQSGLDQAIMDVWQGTEKHESMNKEEDLSEQEVRAALLHIIAITPVLKDRYK